MDVIYLTDKKSLKERVRAISGMYNLFDEIYTIVENNSGLRYRVAQGLITGKDIDLDERCTIYTIRIGNGNTKIKVRGTRTIFLTKEDAYNFLHS